MATNWPNSVQTFTNPTAGSALNSPSHADQHTTVNDTVEALQNYAGMVLVKSQTVGSSVSSVTVTNAFSATFSNYRVSFTGFNCSASSGETMQIRLGNGGTIYSDDYWGGGQSVLYTGTVNTWVAYDLAQVSCCYLTTTPGRTSTVFDVHEPYDNTLATPFMGFGHGFLSGSWWSYEYALTGRITDIYFFPSSGTLSGGTIRVYGYNNG